MIIGKDAYDITEDMLKVIISDENGERLIISKYVDKENITLKDIEEESRKHTDSLREIIVIAENPLNGRVMRFNTITSNWSLAGTLLGYA